MESSSRSRMIERTRTSSSILRNGAGWDVSDDKREGRDDPDVDEVEDEPDESLPEVAAEEEDDANEAVDDAWPSEERTTRLPFPGEERSELAFALALPAVEVRREDMRWEGENGVEG